MLGMMASMYLIGTLASYSMIFLFVCGSSFKMLFQNRFFIFKCIYTVQTSNPIRYTNHPKTGCSDGNGRKGATPKRHTHTFNSLDGSASDKALGRTWLTLYTFRRHGLSRCTCQHWHINPLRETRHNKIQWIRQIHNYLQSSYLLYTDSYTDMLYTSK